MEAVAWFTDMRGGRTYTSAHFNGTKAEIRRAAKLRAMGVGSYKLEIEFSDVYDGPIVFAENYTRHGTRWYA